MFSSSNAVTIYTVLFYHSVFWNGFHEQLESFKSPIECSKAQETAKISLQFWVKMGRKGIRSRAGIDFVSLQPVDCPGSLDLIPLLSQHILFLSSPFSVKRKWQRMRALCCLGELILKDQLCNNLLMQRLVAFWRNLNYKNGICWCVNKLPLKLWNYFLNCIIRY